MELSREMRRGSTLPALHESLGGFMLRMFGTAQVTGSERGSRGREGEGKGGGGLEGDRV